MNLMLIDVERAIEALVKAKELLNEHNSAEAVDCIEEIAKPIVDKILRNMGRSDL